GVLGRMEAIFEYCVKRLTETIRYERPLSEWPNVQSEIGKSYIDLLSSQALLHEALRRITDGEHDPLFDPVVSAAKYHVTEKALELAMRTLRLLGGSAYLKELPYERCLRDFCGLISGAGTQETLEVNLGARIIGELERSFGRTVR